ncbi:hypothetical protein EBH_0021550 [Eimeria brunetti]|uniref:Uncharacterized protein n=1 Tax=Eimeria brunetti TaxID=51314 RepID=U6LLI2_9EIME|nr:hypothetical protein EBH_0021550 [Eimeria brunetti]
MRIETAGKPGYQTARPRVAGGPNAISVSQKWEMGLFGVGKRASAEPDEARKGQRSSAEQHEAESEPLCSRATEGTRESRLELQAKAPE